MSVTESNTRLWKAQNAFCVFEIIFYLISLQFTEYFVTDFSIISRYSVIKTLVLNSLINYAKLINIKLFMHWDQLEFHIDIKTELTVSWIHTNYKLTWLSRSYSNRDFKPPSLICIIVGTYLKHKTEHGITLRKLLPLQKNMQKKKMGEEKSKHS